jgi:hypothetical protein
LTKRIKDVSSLYAAGSLEVQIEHDRQPVPVSEDLIFTIEWFPIEDVQRLWEYCPSRVTETRYDKLCHKKTIYIAEDGLWERARSSTGGSLVH